MRVRPVEAGECARSRLVEAHAEKKSFAPLRQELLERLLGHVAVRRRPGGRSDREKRALEVAARRLVALACAEVSADGPLRADLEVGDVGRARTEWRRHADEVLDRCHRADRDARALRLDPGQARTPEHQRLRRARRRR